MDNSRAIPPVVDEATAEKQDRALAVVHRLLAERGIRARRHHTISLGLFGDHAGGIWPDRSLRRYWLDRYPPELTVTGPQGGRDATVTMGPRSGCYLVSLRNGPDLETVRSEQPERVADLIATAMTGGDRARESAPSQSTPGGSR
ncbi:hypothetical protein [Planomonospora algeriensis]